ncbi:GAP family protein [Microbacterium sp.]|uniref:GAP family protein n=1 Tax=Microbacterium sp. TaxID=51671 RepID=UPI0037CB71F5
MAEWLVLIALGLTVAFTTIPIVTTIVVVLSSGTSRPGWLITIGYAAALLVIVGLFAGVLHAVRLPQFGDKTLIGWIEVVAGLLMVTLGIIQIVRRRNAPPRTSPLVRGVRNLTPTLTVALGASFAIHPEALLLTATAATRVRHEDPSLLVLVIMLAVFVAASVSTVAGITVLFSVARGGVRARMERFQDWIERDSGFVMSIVLVLVGVFVLLLGTGNLGWIGIRL